MGWRLSETLVLSREAHGGVQAVYSVHARYSQFPNRTCCLPRRSTSRAKQSRFGVRGRQGQGIGRGDRVDVEVEMWSTSGPRWWSTSTSTANYQLGQPQGTEAGGQGGPGRAWAKAAAKLCSASPTAVPEDFANIAYRFIQDWAATQPQCPRPGFPIKRRRSHPRASPREPNPARPSALPTTVGTWVVSTWHVDNHSNSMQEQWTPTPRGGPRARQA